MIKRHHKISYLRRDLARTPAARWIAQAPGEMVDGFLCSPAALAAWGAECRPDLLEKPSVGVLVLGSMLDGFDGGAWWTLFSAALEKGVDWARVVVMVPADEGAVKRSGFIPASLTGAVRVVRGNLPDFKSISPESIDIVYLPFAETDSWCPLLGHEGWGLWPFLDAKATLVLGLLEAPDLTLCRDVANQYELDSQWLANRFYAPTSGLMAQAPVLVSATGTKPQDLTAAHDHATDLTEVKSVIKELSAARPGREPEDYRLWGMRSAMRSSLDAQDHYVSLPRGLAVRLATGKIYRVENDLAVGDAYRCGILPESIADCPAVGEHWTRGVFWAARAWEAGLGKFYDNTFGASLDKLGAGDMRVADVLDGMLGDQAPEHKQLLKDALTGGAPYAPSRDERLLFDLVDRRASQEIVELVQKNKALLNSFNEDRLPLLVMLGLRNLPEVMRQVIALGADPLALDGGHRPVIVELARRANREAIEVLLQAGAPANCQDPMGWTPLLCALMTRNWGTVMLFLDFGANPRQPNAMGVSPASIAAGEQSEIVLLAKKAMDAMKHMTDFDMAKSLRAAGLGVKAEDISAGDTGAVTCLTASAGTKGLLKSWRHPREKAFSSVTTRRQESLRLTRQEDDA